MSLGFILIIILIAFVFEFLDVTLGMGYGTALTSILLLLDFSPLEIIPAILLTGAIGSLFGGYFHHRFGNVNFSLKDKDFTMIVFLITCGLVGMAAASFLVVRIPEDILKILIGFLIISLGFIVLIRNNKSFKFRWRKLIAMGLIASFCKGISGGGYGSMIVGGQILSGVDGKKAIGTATIAEGFVSIAGVLIFLLINKTINLNWPLIFSLAVGGVISAPFAAYTVKRFNPKQLKYFVGITSMILGASIITKLFI